MSLLHCDRPTAVGFLELLWHFTSEFAPQGDIGRYDDKRIEAALDYRPRGARKAGMLLRALIDSRWVDISDVYRLVVHDWEVHCDSYTRDKLNRSKLPFVKFQSVRDVLQGKSTTSLGAQTEPQTDPMPVPVPMPVPLQQEKPPKAKYEYREWCNTADFITEKFPATDPPTVMMIIEKAVQAHISNSENGTVLTDQILCSIVRAVTVKNQNGPMLYMKTVPVAVANEVRAHERKNNGTLRY